MNALAHVHLDGRVIFVGLLLPAKGLNVALAVLVGVIDQPSLFPLAPRSRPCALADSHLAPPAQCGLHLGHFGGEVAKQYQSDWSQSIVVTTLSDSSLNPYFLECALDRSSIRGMTPIQSGSLAPHGPLTSHNRTVSIVGLLAGALSADHTRFARPGHYARTSGPLSLLSTSYSPTYSLL